MWPRDCHFWLLRFMQIFMEVAFNSPEEEASNESTVVENSDSQFCRWLIAISNVGNFRDKTRIITIEIFSVCCSWFVNILGLNSEYIPTQFDSSGKPIGNGIWQIEWLRDRWHHVTLKGQGCDPNMLLAYYFKTSCRCRLGYNRVHIGNGIWGIKWSYAQWRYITWKGKVVF